MRKLIKCNFNNYSEVSKKIEGKPEVFKKTMSALNELSILTSYVVKGFSKI